MRQTNILLLLSFESALFFNEIMYAPQQSWSVSVKMIPKWLPLTIGYARGPNALKLLGCIAAFDGVGLNLLSSREGSRDENGLTIVRYCRLVSKLFCFELTLSMRKNLDVCLH